MTLPESCLICGREKYEFHQAAAPHASPAGVFPSCTGYANVMTATGSGYEPGGGRSGGGGSSGGW